MDDKPCAYCSAMFTPYSGKQRYCDGNCWRLAKNARQRKGVKPAPCVDCGEMLIRISALQKRCSKCARKRRKFTKNRWLKRNPEKAKLYYSRQRDSCRASQMRRYDRNERFKSEIAQSTNFIELVRARILRRRGDTISCRSLVWGVFKELGLDVPSHSGEVKYCYGVAEDLCRALGGVEVDWKRRGGAKFQFKERPK